MCIRWAMACVPSLSMKSGIKFGFIWNSIASKDLMINLLRDSICFSIFHVSNLMQSTCYLPIPITNPLSRKKITTAEVYYIVGSQASNRDLKIKRERKKICEFNHIDVKCLRKLSRLLSKRFIALMHNSASWMRQCANWMVERQRHKC